MPSLRQLGYLVALRDHGHFGRAAAACFVTQSTLSVGLAELERVLGTLLVERSRRGVRFTGAGEEVVARARATIGAAEDLVAAARGAGAPLVGPLRLAVIPTIAPFLLPAILAGAGARWPGLRLFVREMLTGPACAALRTDAADCVLLALPADCGDVDTVELLRDPLLLAVPASEDASDAGVAYDAIDPARLLLLEDGHCLRDHALAACRLSAAALPAPLIASTLHTLVRLVDAGLGITLLPRMGLDSGILHGTRVTGHPVKGVRAERRVALAWRRGNHREREFRLLGETIREAIAPAPVAGDVA